MKTNPPLILASTSKYRAQLLSQLGFSFSCEAPGVDEELYKGRGLSPEKLALELSRLKAQAVQARHAEAWVIGSDQVCALGDRILSKPGSVEAAVEQLKLMSGRTHQLITAVSIASPKGVKSFINQTSLHMRALNEDQLRKYVQEDLPLDCAGSYKLEERGIKLFSKIEMEDHTAIIGLPLIQLCTALTEDGFSL